MPSEDSYITLSTQGEAVYTEKRSKFLAFAQHVASEDEAKDVVGAYRKKYYDARHVCYAYILGDHSEKTRANDDGEPSGSAGQPILRQIVSHGLTYTLVVVVRYFGGVKLGTGGLAVAYKTAAGDALDMAETEECIIRSTIKAHVPYTEVDAAMRLAKRYEADVLNREYEANETVLTFAVRQGQYESFRTALQTIFTIRLEDSEEV